MQAIFTRFSRMVEVQPNQEKIITYMRQFGFKFVTLSLLKELYPKVELTERDSIPDMTFMVRRVKRKIWDNRFILGIKLQGKKRKTISVYLEGEHLKNVTKPWKDEQDINFRKIVIKMVFPDYLTYQQRRDWRKEHDRVVKDSKYQPSEFYLKVKPDIRWINQ